MRPPRSMKGLEEFSRTRLSRSFFMRDFLYSEIAGFHGIPNLPEDPDLTIAVGRALCETLLEPLQDAFGRLAIRAGYRSRRVTAFGHERGECGSVTDNAAYHIWDLRDAEGQAGGAAIVVVPWFADRYVAGDLDCRNMAWWIHDHLPYSHVQFMPRLAAIRIQWHQKLLKRIDSYARPRCLITKAGMANQEGNHAEWYEDFPNAASKIPLPGFGGGQGRGKRAKTVG